MDDLSRCDSSYSFNVLDNQHTVAVTLRIVYMVNVLDNQHTVAVTLRIVYMVLMF